METKARLSDLNMRHEALKEERNTWEPDWKQLSRLFCPRKARFVEKETNKTNRGGLHTSLFTNVGIQAARTLAAGMQGGMTSPARPWFKLDLQDNELAKHGPVRKWLDEVEKRMRTLMARTNFYEAIHSIYQELGVFGTSFAFSEQHERYGIRFEALTVGEYYLDANHLGRIDTVFRVLHMTARNIVAKFGEENCSNAVKNAYRKSPYERFEVVHAVLPREEYDKKRTLDPKSFEFGSYWFELGATDKLLRESGFKSFPGFGPRWDVTGQDVYGRSPAMDTIADVSTAQTMRKTLLRQIHKEVDPPTISSGNLKNLNILPGGQNFTDMANGRAADAASALYQVRSNLAGAQVYEEKIKQEINEGMYVDLFRMLLDQSRAQITAEEVARKNDEKLILLGPVLERLHSELLIPIIDRTYDLMEEGDLIPEPPDELIDQPLKVEFTSILAQAQQLVATGSIERVARFASAYSEVWPEMKDAVAPLEMIDRYGEAVGAESSVLTSKDERDAKEAERQEAIAAAQNQERLAAAAQTAKTAADTPMAGGETSALDMLLSGNMGSGGSVY